MPTPISDFIKDIIDILAFVAFGIYVLVFVMPVLQTIAH